MFHVNIADLKLSQARIFMPNESQIALYKGDVLLEFSSVKWDLNEDHKCYWIGFWKFCTYHFFIK